MDGGQLPPITLTADQADRLSELADAAARAYPEVTAFLEREVSRAAVVPPGHIGADVVLLGSRVTFRDEAGAVSDVTLVLPERANVSEGRVSVLTPVGVALIGMAVGQTISYTTRRGPRRITVVSVSAASAE